MYYLHDLFQQRYVGGLSSVVILTNIHISGSTSNLMYATTHSATVFDPGTMCVLHNPRH